MINIGVGAMHRANRHECLFAFIEFTVKIKRFGYYNGYIGPKLEKFSGSGKRGIKHKPTMSYCYLFSKIIDSSFIPLYEFSGNFPKI